MRRLILAIPFILLAVVLMAAGNTYYVTQSGTGNGLTSAAPDNVANFNANTLDGPLAAGDTVYLGGLITTQLTVPVSGLAGNYITLRGDYPGNPCIIDTTGIVINATADEWNDGAVAWTDTGGNIWTWANTFNVNRLWIDGVEQPENTDGVVTATNPWFDDGTTYIYSTHASGPVSDFSTMVGNRTSFSIYLTDKDYIEIQDMEIRSGWYAAIYIANCQRLKIHDCTIGSKARNGIQIVGLAAGGDENTYIDIYENTIDGNNTMTTALNLTGLQEGIELKGSGYYVSIYKNTIKNWGHSCIYVYADALHGDYTHGISYCSIYGNDISAPDADYCNGLTLVGVNNAGESWAHHNNVYGNKFHDLTVRIQFGGHDNKFYNNLVWAIRNDSTRAGKDEVAQGLLIAAWAAISTCEDIVIANNGFYDCDEPAIIIDAPEVNVLNATIANNVGMDCGKDSNYTPDLDNYQLYVPEDAQVQAISWLNNDFYKSGTTDLVYNGLQDGNDYARTVAEFNSDTGDDGGGLGGAQTITSNIGSDPLFVDASAGTAEGFRLTRDSPCRDTGVSLTGTVDDDYWGHGRPQGAGYDMGADEIVKQHNNFVGPGRMI